MKKVQGDRLANIRIASPCRVPWSSMTGDEKIRNCGQCKLSVYNLSEMSNEAAEQFLAAGRDGRLCISYYKRFDGTILTTDCPMGLKLARAAARRLAYIVAACVSFVVSILPALSKSEQTNPERIRMTLDEFVINASGYAEHVYGDAPEIVDSFQVHNQEPLAITGGIIIASESNWQNHHRAALRKIEQNLQMIEDEPNYTAARQEFLSAAKCVMRAHLRSMSLNNAANCAFGTGHLLEAEDLYMQAASALANNDPDSNELKFLIEQNQKLTTQEIQVIRTNHLTWQALQNPDRSVGLPEAGKLAEMTKFLRPALRWFVDETRLCVTLPHRTVKNASDSRAEGAIAGQTGDNEYP